MARDTWQEQTLLVGRALATEDAARVLVSEVEARIEAVRPDLEGRTFSWSYYYEPGAIEIVAHPEDSAARFVQSLGLVLTPEVMALASGEVSDEIIGLEQLTLLDADLLLMTHASPELRLQIEANPLFASVPTVAEGRYLALDLPVNTAMRNPSVLRIAYALDELVPDLTKALQP